MTEHALLYVIAVAVVINAVAWIVVAFFGLRLQRELTEMRDSLTSEVRAMLNEVLPLIRETRGTVTEVRHMTQSGRRIAEEVAAAILLRRISPQWFPQKSALKMGIGVAREGMGFLRGWLHRREQNEIDMAEDLGVRVPSPPSS